MSPNTDPTIETIQVFPPVRMSPAARFEQVMSLLCPYDENGYALPPLISREQAIALLDMPYLTPAVVVDREELARRYPVKT